MPGLFQDSYQGDSKEIHIFDILGVNTSFDSKGVYLSKKELAINQMDFDFSSQPDLAQTFVVTCALLNIPFRFTGLQTLKIKETDRIAALICEMRKLGYVLHEAEDSILYWDGERCERSRDAIDTYEDHRMAMAFAPACLVLPDICINDPHVVSKSYPRYWVDLRAAGFTIEEEE